VKLQKLKRITVAAAVAAIGVLASGASFGGDAYPSRPVSLVVPYGPGGNGDLAARAFAAAVEYEKLIDQPIVVENRTGAGGTIGTQYVRRAEKDGYTLLLARIGSQVVAPALDPKTPYKWDDLTPIGLLEVDPYVCVVRADSPYKTFKQLLDAIKANPGKLSFATSSNMDASVVFPVKAFLDYGLPADAAIKVAYKGGGATVAPVLGKVVDFTCNGLAPYVGGIKGGTLRALVVSTPHRIPESPDTPTAAELGMKDLEMVSGWSALYGPPGLPPEIVKYWASILQKVKSSPFWLKQVKKRGTVPTVLTPMKTAEFAGEQFTAYNSLSKYIGPDK
jgi:tripartite-type tricarboxylate transporter receptor subunit TctC